MEPLDPHALAQAVYAGIRTCAVQLRPDCHAALDEARATAHAASASARETTVLDDLLANARIATADDVPLCQDTGSVWVCLEAGADALIPGTIFSEVDDAVARAYVEGGLRMSILEDALFNRTNTHTNAPAFCEVRLTPHRASKLHVMLKGGGSDNASRLVMLPPGAGRAGVKQVVLDAVQEKAANACPPLVVGVGVGGTFDKVAGLSKRALLRRVGTPAATEEAAAFEQELLEAINELGIGPAALGGACTALSVHLETAPCHIAALPVAVNLGCCAMRSATFWLTDAEGRPLDEPRPANEEEGCAL